MKLFVAVLMTWSAFAGREGEFDFEFEGMELYKAVSSIAKLMKKNVVFASGVENRPITFSLRDATPEAALKLLLDANGFLAVERNGALQVIQATDRGPAAQPTVVIPLKNVIAKDLEQNVRLFVNDKGTVSINDQLNAFIVSASEDKLVSIRNLISELDKEANQVYIEAKIVETSTTFSRDFGLEWGDTSVRLAQGNGVNVFAPSGANPNLTLKTSASLGTRASIDVRLQAAEENGEAKVLSSPKITTLNGIPAVLENQRQISVKVLSQNAANPGTQQTTGIQQITSGLNLQVTPFIVSGDQVRLNINLSKSDPLEDGVELPTIAASKATTALVVRNRQTAAIGGLVSNSYKDSSRGVPFLSTLPILGMLFGNNLKTKKFNELIIFITPTIFVGSRGISQAAVPEPEDSEAASLDVLRGAEEGVTSPNLVPSDTKLPAAEPIPLSH